MDKLSEGREKRENAVLAMNHSGKRLSFTGSCDIEEKSSTGEGKGQAEVYPNEKSTKENQERGVAQKKENRAAPCRGPRAL